MTSGNIRTAHRYKFCNRCSRRHPRNNRQCAAKAMPGYHECRFHAAQTAEGLALVEKDAQKQQARRELQERRQARQGRSGLWESVAAACLILQ